MIPMEMGDEQMDMMIRLKMLSQLIPQILDTGSGIQDNQMIFRLGIDNLNTGGMTMIAPLQIKRQFIQKPADIIPVFQVPVQ